MPLAFAILNWKSVPVSPTASLGPKLQGCFAPPAGMQARCSAPGHVQHEGFNAGSLALW